GQQERDSAGERIAEDAEALEASVLTGGEEILLERGEVIACRRPHPRALAVAARRRRNHGESVGQAIEKRVIPGEVATRNEQSRSAASDLDFECRHCSIVS